MGTKPQEQRGSHDASDWRHVATTGVSVLVHPEEYRRVAQSQIEWALRVAEQIERGEALSSFDGEFAAALCRHWAQTLPLEQPKKRGQQPQWDHGSEAMVFVTLRARGVSPSDAYAEIADRVGVSEQAVEKAMRKHAPAAARLLEDGFGQKGIPAYLFRK